MQNIIELARDMAKKYTVRNVLIASLGDGAKMAAQVFGTEHYTIHAIGNPEDTNDAAVAEKIQNLENGLAQASMDWAHQHGWLRLEIHRVYTGSGTCSPAWEVCRKDVVLSGRSSASRYSVFRQEMKRWQRALKQQGNGTERI